MWDEETRRATLIDFDVATFYDPVDLHRRCVGTDGYMAPEVLSVSEEVERLESLDRYKHGRRRKEKLAEMSRKV